MRAIVLSASLLALALAPVQCTKKYDDGLRREDSAGDGLWGLAEDFRAKGDEQSAVATLRFLVKRYPNSRRAPKAKEALEKRAGGAADAPFAASAPSGSAAR